MGELLLTLVFNSVNIKNNKDIWVLIYFPIFKLTLKVINT
jgi:hypothetical protein